MKGKLGMSILSKSPCIKFTCIELQQQCNDLGEYSNMYMYNVYI
jgi:hypothetical protein